MEKQVDVVQGGDVRGKKLLVGAYGHGNVGILGILGVKGSGEVPIEVGADKEPAVENNDFRKNKIQ